MDLHIDKSSVCKLRKMSDRNQAERPFHTRGEDCILEEYKNFIFYFISILHRIFEKTQYFSNNIYCDIKKGALIIQKLPLGSLKLSM